MGLNEKQMEAVNVIEGQLLILAGAGSGKTTVLMNRIAHMINKGINPWNILALTFTNKAANEMKERITNHSPKELADKINMSTFHSLCLDILKREWKHLNIFSKQFDVSDQSNSASYLRGLLKGKTKTKPTTILKYISNLKNELVDSQTFISGDSDNPHIDWNKVKEVIEEIDSEHLKILEAAYPKYEKLLKEKNLADFDDLIMLTVKLFLENPEILQKYQDRYRYIMVDEYQDTNRSQYILIKLLAGKYKNLAVVGDDFQSIYAFRGSDIRNILNFDKDYPEAKIIKLEQNYRSTKNIIKAANEVIFKNKNQKKKTLFTDNEKGDNITIFKSEYANDGADYVAQTILELVQSGKRKFEDFTVLYRNNSLSADVELAFSNYSVPYVKLSGRGFFETEEAQDIINYLAFIHNTNNLSAFSRIIRKPKRRIAEKTIKKIENEFYDGNLLEILDDLSAIERVQKKAVEEGKKFAEMIRKYQQIKDTVSVSEIIKGVLEEIEYEEKILSAYDSELKKTKKQNIDKLIEMIVTDEAKTGKKRLLDEYVEEIILYNHDDEGENSDSVKLMTIHGSKGLEFPVVFMIGMNQEIFPSLRFQNNGNQFDYEEMRRQREKMLSDLEEERRMCYVGFTRAKEQLYLTYSSHRILKKDGSRKPMNPSQFLSEFEHDSVHFIE